jgi:CheY-like chemotaxis protein
MKHIGLKLPLRILLADDDETDRFFFGKALKEISIDTHFTTVNDGEQLMRYLTKHQDHLPDVLFLDLNMPRKNGQECLLEMKSNPKIKHLPVVIYSTSLHDDVADELYKIGAHYYLQKCNYFELIPHIHRVLSLLIENHAQPPKNKFIVDLQEA